MAAATRVLIAELDSPAQSDRFAQRGARTALTELTGMLRIGVLVSSRILVTDAMLLDGAYFVALGPEGVLRELGAAQGRYPLTITGVHASLREGLESRLADPAFRWSLTGVGGAGSVAPDVRRSWDDWLRVVESGVVQYEQQTGGKAPLRTGPPPVRTPESLMAVAGSGLAELRHRSSAWRVIDGLSLDAQEREDVRRWWNDAYSRMIAENAAADWVSFDAETLSALTARRQDVELPLSSALVEWARESTPATIAVAWDASHAQRRRLHARPTWARVRDLAFATTRVVSAPSRISVLLASVAKLAVALVVVALALPGLQIGSIDSPWTWIGFAGAIATTVPFDALWALRELLVRDPRARLVLHRGGAS